MFMVTSMLLAGSGIPEQGEERFRGFKHYKLKDFNPAWDISYFEIVTFTSDPSDGKSFRLAAEPGYRTIFKAGSVKMDSRRQKELDWLTRAVMTADYFWKAPWPPVFIYDFTSLRFIDGSGRLKAIETLTDIRDMLGTIDTEAELYLWIYAHKPARPAYSYKKEGGLYRVRFKGIDIFTCLYDEYFIYYDTRGKAVRTQKLRSYRDRSCIPVRPI